MEQPILGADLAILKKCENFARRFLIMPQNIDYCFEDCPSERFTLETNCSETDGHTVYFNLPWFRKQLPDYQKNLELFAFHELRHVHQMYAISALANHRPYREAQEVVRRWKYDFDHYVRNVDAESQEQNLIQEIELDANGYALSLLNLYYASQGEYNMQLRHSIPGDIYPRVNARSQEYYRSMPEFKQAVEKIRKNPRRVPRPVPATPQLVKKVPPQNSFCPCGSGKKFKKCCMGKGIYD